MKILVTGGAGFTRPHRQRVKLKKCITLMF